MIAFDNYENFKPPGSVSRILAVTMGGLGDAVLFSPVLKALRLRYQNAKIELLLASKLAECAYQDCNEVESTHLINTQRKSDLVKASEIVKFSLKIRKIGKYDIAVFATGLNPLISKLIENIGNISIVYNAPKAQKPTTDLECNIKLAKIFTGEISSNDVFISVTEESESEAESALKNNRIYLPYDRLVAVYPSTNLWNRPRWELSKLLDVIRSIKSKELNVRFVIIGSAADGDDWGKVDKVNVADANLAGKLSILGQASILKRCNLSICNDGGIMHVAAAVKSPLVAIMPNTPANYYPPGDNTKIIHSNLSCAVSCHPNRPNTCEIPQCVNEISVEQVVQACLHSLT